MRIAVRYSRSRWSAARWGSSRITAASALGARPASGAPPVSHPDPRCQGRCGSPPGRREWSIGRADRPARRGGAGWDDASGYGVGTVPDARVPCTDRRTDVDKVDERRGMTAVEHLVTDDLQDLARKHLWMHFTAMGGYD